ncbi:beta-N-acetylhexosaminidase [Paenibacillus sp. PvR052]
MNKSFRALCLTVWCALLLAGLTSCIGSKQESGPPAAVSEEPQKEVKDPIQERIERMSQSEKIGQMMLVGLDGYELGENARALIDTYRVGGFIFYKRNINDGLQLVELVNTLKAVNHERGAPPLWLSVDEEGGRVTRMPAELAKVPSAEKVGKAGKPELALHIGQALGEGLSAFGLNMNFAPVLDVNSNPGNPVIGNRSYDSNAERVGMMGVQMMMGLQSSQVVPVVKHFPGHGDTSVDSHIGLPVVNHDLDRLRSLELKPFAEAVRSGADAVMVAHILLPKLDPEAPATFSKPVITELLRKELGFTGVVITDDLTMGAIVKHYDIGQAAVRSVEAGSDVLLVGHGFDEAVSVFYALQQAVSDGVLTVEQLDQSVDRILRLKEKYKLDDENKAVPDLIRINSAIRSAVTSLDP